MLNRGIIEEQITLKNFVNLLLNLMSDFLDLKLSMEEVLEREGATSWKRRGKHLDGASSRVRI